MNKVALRLLPLLAASALAGCGGIPLPEQSLPDASLTIPAVPDAAFALLPSANIFKEAPLIDSPLDSRVKDIRVDGVATLSAPATQALSLDVLMTNDLDTLTRPCLSVDGYRACVGGGTKVGSINVAAGQTVGTVNMSGDYLTQLVHAGKGYIGLRLAKGSLAAGTTLSLTNMKVNAKGSLF